MALIQANRTSIDDRFSVLGFTVRTENPLFEIGLATDPELLKSENRARRNAGNFFTSSLLGANTRRGEAVYLVPPNVVARFVGQPRLYFGLATYHENNRSQPASVKTPDLGSMYVNLSGLTERGLRRTARSNGAGAYGNGNGQGLTWGGDALATTARRNGNGAASNGNGGARAAMPNGESAPYSDGYSDDLWKGGMTAAPNGVAPPVDAGAAAAVPASTQAWRMRGLSADDQDDDSRGIEGPIPDHNPADDPTFSTPQGVRALNVPASEYPQAARFVPAYAGNFRATTSPRAIDRIVIHITDGGANINGTIGWFQNPAAGVSAHYVIGQDGEIVQMVRHQDVAWHARSANRTSIGIEHVANTRGLNPTPAQMCASAALVTWLCDQYGIAADRTHILGHAEADTATTHTGCPNAVWDWAYYMEMITTRTCFEPASTTANTLGYRGMQPLTSRPLQRAYAPNGRQATNGAARPYAKPLLVGSYDQPSSWWDALTTQLGHFARGALWFLGVADTTQPPYSAICQVRRPNGTSEGAHVGTAFFIGPRLLLTAAHVVDGESELIIVPGKNGGGTGSPNEPFGRFHVTQFRKHGSYGVDGHDNDMALICVPAANAVTAPNYFGLVEELTQSRPEGVVVSGYAAWWHAVSDIEIFVNNNIDQNRQHAHGGYIRELPTEGTFTYDLQTLAGTSGSPVYWIEGDTQPIAHLVGVHVAANDDRTNRGCRITQEKLRWIRDTAAAWGQTLTFSLGAHALGDATVASGEEDPDTIGISEDEPVPTEAVGSSTQVLRVRALNAPAPDYPAASRFVPAHARNFTVGRRRDRVLDRIVIHITAGGPSINGTIGWFQNGARVNERTGKAIRSSAHYIVGREGEVVQMVRNADTAHHASAANSRSIGIEHNANKPSHRNARNLPPTAAQYEASARLVAWLCQQHDLQPDREHIRGHMEISPGDNHECPSDIWDWDHYMACVQIATAALAAPSAQSLGNRAYANRPYATAQDIITPFYDPADPSSALTCQADAFSLAREEWFAGVPNTTLFPHSAICLLEMKNAAGSVVSRGTGFYIGPHRVLTCAHNLHGKTSVDIIPGNNGQGNEPFGRCNASAWRIPNSYAGPNTGYDLAVIDDVPLQAPNYQWFDVLEELRESRPEGVVVCGYSSRSVRVPDLTAAIDGFKQHLHAGYIAALGSGDSTFDYPILTLKRASGSPVYYISDKDGSTKAYIVGVHTGSVNDADDVNRGCRLTQAKIDWIEGRTTTLGVRSSALGDAFSVHWNDVQLVMQDSRMSCWAAAAAMVVGWRDQVSIPATEIAAKVPVFDAYRTGLYGRERVHVADAWNLVSEAPASYTIEAWRDMLAQNGPLYIDQVLSANSSAGHVRVLVGMSSGGAADGSDTIMYFHDPGRGRITVPFNQFLKLYEGRTASTNGSLEFQIMHAEGPVSGRHPASAAAFSLGAQGIAPRALSDDSSDYPVALIPQPDKNACWAASMAMLLSHRRNASFAPETLANEVGGSLASSYSWDLLTAVRSRYGFEEIAQPSNTSLYHAPQQWAQWLGQYGPLWVVIVGAPHAVVIAGIKGDLARPQTVQVKVLNPWDTRVVFDNDPVAFNPRNGGYEDWLSFEQFAADFGNMAAADYGNWRVLHLPATAAGAQSVSQSLGMRGRRLAAAPASRAFSSDADFASSHIGSPIRETREPIDPSRIAGTRMSVLCGQAGGSRWALDQLEGQKSPTTPGAAAGSSVASEVLIDLGAWPAIEGEAAPLPLSITFHSSAQGAVGDVQIVAGDPAELGYGVDVVARIEDTADVGNVAAVKVAIDYRFKGFAQDAPAARIEVRLLGDGRYERVNRWLTTTQAA